MHDYDIVGFCINGEIVCDLCAMEHRETGVERHPIFCSTETDDVLHCHDCMELISTNIITNDGLIDLLLELYRDDIIAGKLEKRIGHGKSLVVSKKNYYSIRLMDTYENKIISWRISRCRDLIENVRFLLQNVELDQTELE